MPLLYELRPLPTEIGGVPIEWFDPPGRYDLKVEDQWKRFARRERKKLHLPRRPESVFLPLGEGKLLFINMAGQVSANRGYSFCGMDEAPFHSFVTSDAVEAYKEGGPEGFLESLVPSLMKMLRGRSDIPDGYARQGDWFANQLPFSWEEVERFVRLGRDREISAKEVKREPLNGTRHLFTGRIAMDVPLFERNCMLVEGTISSPNHRPLVLSGAPHVIARAANLVNAADPEDNE